MSFQNNNTTNPEQSIKQIEMIAEEVYNYLYGDLIYRVFYFFVIGVVLIFGPILCTTMVLFEQFGADSQKRNILNRLCSYVFVNASILSFLWSLLRILRDSFGLLNWNLFYPISIIFGWLNLSCIMFITEITVFRFFYIVVWKRMKVIDDEFWTSVASKSTYLAIFYIILLYHVMGGKGYDTGQFILVMTPQDRK